MAGHAPAAIRQLFDRLKTGGYPGAELSGIFADKPGYHNARHNVAGHDYSVQRADDRVGDGWAASALDVTLRNPADMTRLTGRLIELTHARDPRVQCLREFFGTVNGRQVTGLDVRDVRWVTSDDSHLWHVHISVYRRFAADVAAMHGVADAILGGVKPPAAQAPQPEQEDDDEMKPYFIRANGTEQLYLVVADKIIKQSDDEGRIASAIYGVPFTITLRAAEGSIQNLGQQLERRNGQR